MWIYASSIAGLNMKIVMFKLVALAAISFLSGCGESFLELSNFRMEVIDRLEASKLIPDDQRLPPNIRKSNSISVIEFDYQKKSVESLPDEGGILKIELLHCSNNELQESSFMYADKVNVSVSTNKREVLMSAQKAYFFVDSYMAENGCFRILFKSMSRSKRSAVYRLS
jgi:hypothetical protein